MVSRTADKLFMLPRLTFENIFHAIFPARRIRLKVKINGFLGALVLTTPDYFLNMPTC
jgi:hypothetical protein